MKLLVAKNSPRAAHVLGDARDAANEPDLTPEDVEAEVRRLEADAHNVALKQSGELERRRVAFAHRLDDPFRRGW